MLFRGGEKGFYVGVLPGKASSEENDSKFNHLLQSDAYLARTLPQRQWIFLPQTVSLRMASVEPLPLLGTTGQRSSCRGIARHRRTQRDTRQTSGTKSGDGGVLIGGAYVCLHLQSTL